MIALVRRALNGQKRPYASAARATAVIGRSHEFDARVAIGPDMLLEPQNRDEQQDRLGESS